MPKIVDGEAIRQGMMKAELKTQRGDLREALLSERQANKPIQANRQQWISGCAEEKKEEEMADIVTVW